MSVILRKQSIKYIKHRHIYMPPSVIESSLKSVRVFATESTQNLPDKSSSDGSARNLAALAKINYDRLIGTYEDLSGMKEVRRAQEEVVKIQEKLQNTQEKRREAQLKLLDIQKNCRVIDNNIQAIDKGNPHYLKLVRQQVQLMQQERQTEEYFQLMDANERDLFTHLTSAVRASHEKERSQAENAKYFSMVLTMAGAVLGILGSFLTYHYRSRQFSAISKQGEKLEMQLQMMRTEMTTNFTDLQKEVRQIIHEQKELEKKESWTNYFYRHGGNVYRFFWRW